MTTQSLQYVDNLEPLLLEIEQTILALEQHPGFNDLINEATLGWKNISGVANLFNQDNATRLTAQMASCYKGLCDGNKKVSPELIKASLAMVDLLRHCGNNDIGARPTHNMAATLAPFSTIEASSLVHDHLPKDTKILIVDDEAVNRTLLEEFVQTFNKEIQITSVDSAAEAIFYYLTENFDLVFLDIMMPEVDGNHFISIVEKNRQAGNLVTPANIVVQTAVQSLEELLAMVQKECILEVIRKPIIRERIYTCIERYCPAFQKSLAA